MINSLIGSILLKYWIQSRVLRFSFRAVAAIFFLRFATEALVIFFETRSINYLLLVISELISVGLLIFARDSLDVRMTSLAVLSTVCGTFYYLLMDFFEYSVIGLISSESGAFLQAIGIVLQIYSKLSLGRSFGLLPANRGVVDKGVYSFVRHPIYASYMVGHIGFILSAFNFWNLGILLFAYIFQFIRIKEEEAILRKDASYLAYSERVKWRIFPLIF
jgi:protein-S-isoprenylcysteine O-methyltransferase Ste14